nr:hypothetical protein [Tanacetum cinerariifolium]
MALTFADTHNMIAFLRKSDASEGFDQIVDFLNAQVIQYALMVNPIIYVSCIKQIWSSVSIKRSNDVVTLQALIDRKKVVITEDSIRQDLRLDDADGVDCLQNEEIFDELERMGYEKPSTKLTFYKAFFLAQWKFLIHTILQCMSVKRTAWNEFSSSMASAVIKFNFSKYILESLVRNVDSPSMFLMRIGKGFSGVDTPLFDGMLVPQQAQDVEDAAEDEDDVNEDVTLEEVDAEVTMDADVQGRLEESQAKVVTTGATTITAAQVPKASAPRRRRGVIIQDPKKATIALVIMQSKVKSKDKGKGILVEEPKALKRLAQIEQDEAFARKLEDELNANIN